MAASKYIPEIVDKIIEMVESDSYTIEEICKNVGINKQTYYDWKEKYPEFFDAIKNAQLKFNQNVVIEAKKSLMKKIKGYEVEEKHVTMVESKPDSNGISKPKIKEQKVIKKHIAPDTTAIIFSLTNLDGENFKNRSYTELTGKNGGAIFVEKLTDEEIAEKISALEKIQNPK